MEVQSLYQTSYTGLSFEEIDSSSQELVQVASLNQSTFMYKQHRLLGIPVTFRTFPETVQYYLWPWNFDYLGACSKVTPIDCQQISKLSLFCGFATKLVETSSRADQIKSTELWASLTGSYNEFGETT